MAGKLKNIGTALKDTKTRTILIVVVVIILIGLLIGWLGLRRAGTSGPTAAVTVQQAPSIESIPGGGPPPSREYIKTQEQENILRAQQAARQGTSAIPTITRTTYLGGDETQQLPAIPPANTGSPQCSPEALARARQAGVKADELRCKGCSVDQLRAAGYTAGELMGAGFVASDLKSAGYPADQLKAAGLTATELSRAGFAPSELAAAGFNAAELSQAGITPGQLASAGIPPSQLTAAGIGAKPSNLPKDCSVDALKKARAQGISAGEIRRSLGCSAAALRAAGYTAKELKDAGFSAKELLDAGFSPKELKDAGFSAGDLRLAGVSAKDLKDAGFSANDLRNAGYGADELANAGFSGDELKAAGFSDGDLARAGLAPTIPPPVATITSPTISAIPAGITTPDSGLSALEKLQQKQAEQLSLQERQDRITQLQQTMSQQANELLTSVWGQPALQKYQEGEPDKDQTVTTTTTSGTQVVGQQLAGQEGSFPFIKAGTVMFGVLNTSLNSDEPSPILATIVSCGRPIGGSLFDPCPYVGAKLVGQFQRVDRKVVVNFTLMSLPDPLFPQSIPITAVAIDPNTARTALADSVNNHYLLRYGSLFASAFLSGYAKATEQSGSTTTVSVAGITETGPDLNAGDKAIVGLGQVGNQFAAALGNTFTMPPTVKVNSGAGIGVLFMGDVALTPPSTAPTSGAATAPAATTAATTTAATQTTTVSSPVASTTTTTVAAPPTMVPAAP